MIEADITGSPAPLLIHIPPGDFLDLNDPDIEKIEVETIACALALQCRYNGHTKFLDGKWKGKPCFYSVAQHSCYVHDFCLLEHADNELAFYGLLHDAAEAYTGDIIRGIKRELPLIMEIEEKLTDIICARFGILDWRQYHDAIKFWDNRVLKREVEQLIEGQGAGWDLEDIEAAPITKIVSWSPFIAYEEFMTRFKTHAGIIERSKRR